jgi:ComF family protein
VSAGPDEVRVGFGPGNASGKPSGKFQSWAGLRDGVVRSAFDDLVTTVFPADCRICGKALLRASAVPVCDACRDRAVTRRQTMTLCHRCGEALGMESARFAGQFPAEGLLCHACRLVPPEFARAVAYAVYEDEVRELVHLLKYERMRGVAAVLGGLLADAIDTLHGVAARELPVMAVPLFGAKERQRGYNQSQLLADAALEALRRRRPEWRLRAAYGVLRRVRDTESQFALGARARRQNLRGAFAVDAAAIVPGGEVLLIDDIYTTGSTARECARVLRRAGVRTVWVATLARAQRTQVALWGDEEIVMRVPQGFG